MKTNSLGSGPVNLNQAQPTAPATDSQPIAPGANTQPQRAFSGLKRISPNATGERSRNASSAAARKSAAPTAEPSTLAELPSELIGHIGNNLHLSRDLAALSIASKAAKKELNGSLNVLKRLDSLILLPAENRLPEFKTLLETQATNPGIGLLHFANAISHIRPNNQFNAIKTILDKTNDSSVLTVLASQVGYLPTRAESTDGLHAILGKTADVGVLRALANEISSLPTAEKAAGFRAILNKTDDIGVLSALVNNIRYLHSNQQTAAVHAILDKTDDIDVLSVLATRVGHVPEAEKAAVLHAILDKTDNVSVLSALAAEIGYLPEAERTASLRAILDKTDDLTVRRELEQLSR